MVVSNTTPISNLLHLPKMKQRNYLKEVTPLLDALRNNFQFWISDEVYMAAVKLAGE